MGGRRQRAAWGGGRSGAMGSSAARFLLTVFLTGQGRGVRVEERGLGFWGGLRQTALRQNVSLQVEQKPLLVTLAPFGWTSAGLTPWAPPEGPAPSRQGLLLSRVPFLSNCLVPHSLPPESQMPPNTYSLLPSVWRQIQKRSMLCSLEK